MSNTHHTFVQLNKGLSEKPVNQEGIVEENSSQFVQWLDCE
jgi:hypothetical protein